MGGKAASALQSFPILITLVWSHKALRNILQKPGQYYSKFTVMLIERTEVESVKKGRFK